MQALTEDFKSGDILLGVLREYGRTGKTEYLQITEEVDNVAMALTEMTAVTLIKNHHKLLITEFLNTLIVEVLLNGCIQFLNGGEDYFLIRIESFDQLISIICSINCTRFKGLIFTLGLSIKIMTVNNKKDLINTIQFCHQLCSLE